MDSTRLESELMRRNSQIHSVYATAIEKFKKDVDDGYILHTVEWQTIPLASLCIQDELATSLDAICERHSGPALATAVAKYRDSLLNRLLVNTAGHSSTNSVHNAIEQAKIQGLAATVEALNNLLLV